MTEFKNRRHSELAICVPTCQRPRLLHRLLADIARQTILPSCLIVVDGDPGSGDVRRLLEGTACPAGVEVRYIPSSHANLPFQRYLGWRRAAGASWLLYLDDDLRIRGRDAVEKVLAPLAGDSGSVAAVTAAISFPKTERQHAESTLPDQLSGERRSAWLARRWGGAHKLGPGGLSAAGQRCPVLDRGNEYEQVEWLRGGVMAFRISALSRDCFLPAMFALAEMGCGLGEDTLLGRMVRQRGRLLLAMRADFEHPGDDTPRAYSTNGFRLGYAHAYSRRLLNDHYRGRQPPSLSERVELIRGYAGNILVHGSRAAVSLSRRRVQFAAGYALGALHGVTIKPAAERWAPEIDWEHDALDSLARTVVLQPVSANAV